MRSALMPAPAEFDYAPATRPTHPDSLHAAALAVQDKLYRASFRWRRYGTSLYLRERLAARTGLRGIAARLERKMQDIDDLHLR